MTVPEIEIKVQEGKLLARRVDRRPLTPQDRENALRLFIDNHNRLARVALDNYFAQVIMPRLCNLYSSGKLPNLDLDPLWREMEAAWTTCSVDSKTACDVVAVKELMNKAVESYEAGKS